MMVYCLVPQRDGAAQVIYDGNPAWPAVEIGYLRRAYPAEAETGWIAFDRQSRAFAGETPEAALEASADRPCYHAVAR